MKKTSAVAVSAIALVLGLAGVARADGTPDCKDYYPHKVLVAKGDPYDLDRDGDGLGCDAHPGGAVSQTADKPKSEKEGPSSGELAATGASDVVQRHPVRSAALAGSLVVIGAAGVLAAGRRKGAL